MKLKVLFFLFLQIPFFVFAQKNNTQNKAVLLTLQTGNVLLSPSSDKDALEIIRQKAFWKGNYIWLARFLNTPTAAQKKLTTAGELHLLGKLDSVTYFVQTSVLPTSTWLQAQNITKIAVPDYSLKLSKALQHNDIPKDAIDAAGKAVLLLAVLPNINIDAAKSWLVAKGVSVETTPFEQNTGVFTIHVSPDSIAGLADLPFVIYLQPKRNDQLLNEKMRVLFGAYVANAPLSAGGHALQGKGVTVGVGDLGEGSIHPDLEGRSINMSGGYINNHGSHVSGTIAGGGLLQSERRGEAPLATIINQYLSGIWMYAPQLVKSFGMVVTNNSYGNGDGSCQYAGEYDLYSAILDGQAIDLPVLLHVFAAGNSGNNHCNKYLPFYNTVFSGYQSAKNVITVGRANHTLQTDINNSSSGPVNDGRLKPEIITLGTIQSTVGGAGYEVYYGTSMASPGVTGGVALLYERYRQLFAGKDPDGALIKNILLNGARDVGTPGPDFRNGYGAMHLENSLRILDNHYYFAGKIGTGGEIDTVVTVAPNQALLKIMLYWHDAPGLPMAPKALMNDIDLEVITPNGTIVYPKKLNTNLQKLGEPATEGSDHLNNSEQVIIEKPIPGNYTIRIKGFDISATTNQAFSTSFDFVPTGIKIRTPIVGDNWSITDPSEFGVKGVFICWDDEGTPSGNYTLDYSLDMGATWQPIPADVLTPTIPLILKDTARWYGWRPPFGTVTTKAMIKVNKQGTAFSGTSGAFSILERPMNITVLKPCEGYLTVSWQPVTGADEYEVIMKKGLEMAVVATVANSPYTIKGLNKDSVYYISVRAKKEGIKGRYLYANSYMPNAGNCSTITNGDLKLDSITSPLSSRQFTARALTANQTIKVRIKNLDDIPVAANSYQIKYSVDGGAFAIAQGGEMAAMGTYTHSFSGADLSAPGVHTILAIVKNTLLADPTPENDSFVLTIKNIPNPVITPSDVVNNSFVENFETASAATYQQATVGLDGLNHWDYFNHSQYDRARTFVMSGIAYSGSKAITLDISRQQSDTPYNRLEGTFNLSGNTIADAVRFDFRFKHHGERQKKDSRNKVWVRGNENNAWIEAYDLGANQPKTAGQYKQTSSMELSNILASASPAQTFSSSTQIRFGQTASLGMSDNTQMGGYTFDDIRIYLAKGDMAAKKIDWPTRNSCGLTSATPLKVIVRNTMNHPLSNVRVAYSINDGNFISENISEAIPGNSDYAYEFTTKANFSTFGKYNIVFVVNYSEDNNTANDTLTQTTFHQPLISNFPYLQNFDDSSGSFYAEGLNSSWQWGIPSGGKIAWPASGLRVWKTSLSGNYNSKEMSYLVSPCFNLSGLANPTLSFSFAYDIEDCRPGTYCDSAWVEYSIDGISWERLGKAGEGTNWYDIAGRDIWMKQNQTRWHVATIPLPKTNNILRVRFALSSDEATEYEGITIDDFHVYDLYQPIYTAVGESPLIQKNVSGNSAVHFSHNGKIIASILPNGNNLGTTAVKAYIFNGAVRNFNGEQYYGNRNITIQPQNAISSDSPIVRFYFTDKEVDSLRLAQTCASCTNLIDYTYLGITQYSDRDKSKEDSSLQNNKNGTVRYIRIPSMRLVPYDSGYYAEYKVGGFSEFWLSDGKSLDAPLPANWINIAAVKHNISTVKINWEALAASGTVDYFIVESSQSGRVATNDDFEALTKIFANGANKYEYTDNKMGKSGTYFYRIKMVLKNGNIYYSPIRYLQFDAQKFAIETQPNPVKSKLQITLQTPTNASFVIKIIDITGRTLLTKDWETAAGESVIQISEVAKLPQGIYTIEIKNEKNKWYKKFLKE